MSGKRVATLPWMWLGLASSLSWAAGPMTVSISTERSEVLLKPSAQVPVSILVRDQTKRGVEGVSIKLDASVGTIGNLEDLGQGRYKAIYRMPRKKHPQAVILAALAPHSQPAMTVLKLRSAVNLPVSTSKPNVKIRLNLGNKNYGPITTDQSGQAKVPVVIGPADRSAVVIGVDEFGNRTRRSINIPIPSAPRLCAFADRSELVANSDDKATIYLLAITPTGEMESQIDIVSSAKRGQLSKVEPVRPGLAKVTFLPEGGLEQPKIRFTLALAGEPDRSRRVFSFRLVTGRPSKLNLSVRPAKLMADGRSVALLSVFVQDQAKNPLTGLVPDLRCDRGKLGKLVNQGGGRYQSRLVAPLSGTGSISCEAMLNAAQKQLKEKTQIRLVAPALSHIKLVSSKAELVKDGRSQAQIDIHLTDKSGNPIVGAKVTTSAPIGTLDTVTEDGQGRYHVSYTAPRAIRSSRVRIDVTAKNDQAEISKSLVLMLNQPEVAPPQAPWLMIGPSAAIMTNFSRMVYGGASLAVDLKVPGLGGYLFVSVEGGYRYARSTSTVADSGQKITTEVGYAPLHLAFVVKPFPRRVATPLITIGGGVELVQWTIRDNVGSLESKNEHLLGCHAGFGGEVRIGPGMMVLWLRYLYAFLSSQGALMQPNAQGGSSLKGSIGGMDVSLGYRLMF